MSTSSSSFTIDAAFPGGNIIVDSIHGDDVFLRQDQRTTTEWWFYWHFRIRGAAGRRLRFHFTDGNVFTSAGPCFSSNAVHWRWLGSDILIGGGFSHAFAPDEHETHFAISLPFVHEHLNAFLAARPQISRELLCVTEGGRRNDMLRLSARRPRYTLFLSARTHACESIGSYVLEGAIDFWLNETAADGQFLRESVDVVSIPIVDLDGVQAGDQGKLRAPYDHNRDYSDQPIYIATRAIQAELRRNRLPLLGLDMHCPWIRGGRNEHAYIVEPCVAGDGPRAFAAILEQSRRGEIPCPADQFLAYGQDWNNVPATSLGNFISGLPGARFGVSIEIPYAIASGVMMTILNARGLGRDIARAAAIYLAR